jgi:hypothetical protein
MKGLTRRSELDISTEDVIEGKAAGILQHIFKCRRGEVSRDEHGILRLRDIKDSNLRKHCAERADIGCE